ncbi:MAG: hypothetical protein BGO77_02170 [Caedibacter sp. 37-49]|nr:MAG: hypothetical protein BGO77_02170 [Caedibacter sp. 37-49]
MLRFSFIVKLFLSNHDALSTNGVDEIYDDPNILKVYEQSAVIKDLDKEIQKNLKIFQDLSSNEQQEFLRGFTKVQDRLEEEYKNKKIKLVNQRLIKYGTATIICALAPFILISGINRYLSDPHKIDASVIIPLTMHGFFFFGFKALEIIARKVVSSEGAVQNYEIEYVRSKPFWNRSLSKVFESKLLSVRKNPAFLHDYLKWLNAAINLPFKKKDISIDSFQGTFVQEFSIFSSSIREKIKGLCIRHIIQQNGRVMAYFQGPSGTGKTSCARTIAYCLGLPFGSVALANYSMSDLIGQGGVHQPHPGKIAEAILSENEQEKTYSNMVFLIDEVDEVLNGEGKNDILPFLLTLLDPETKSYYNPYFESDIRIKDMLIILAGNKPISHKPLAKRLVPIMFEGFTKEYKKDYITKKFIPKLYKKTKSPYILDMEKHFSDEDKKKIDKLIDEDDDPGLRNVQEIARQFVDEKIIETFLEEKEKK